MAFDLNQIVDPDEGEEVPVHGRGGPEVEGAAGAFDLNIPADIFAHGGGGPAAAGHEADSVVDLGAEVFPFDLNMGPETFPTEDEQENLQSGMEDHQNTHLAATTAVPASYLSEPLLPGKGADLAGDDLEAVAQLPSYRAAGASFSRTCLNLTNAVSGIGVLSMPYAVSQGGWLGLPLFAAVGAVCYYTGTLIERCMRADPTTIASYPDIGQFAFGAAGRRAIAFFMYVELYLVAVSFLVLEGDNLDKLFPGASLEPLPGYLLQGKQLFVVLAAAVVLPTTWLKANHFLSAGGAPPPNSAVRFCVEIRDLLADVDLYTL
ncbi:hypothetical protein ACP70R_037770 [Stipagrostis hirtigluma subsp. patula]